MAVKLSEDDHFHLGVLVSLAVVYSHGQDTIAEEIVGACDCRELLRLARQQRDPSLKSLRKTIAFLEIPCR